ncbi:MAG: nucleotidyltransferase [Chitinophagaceae bacterium]|jgi:D-glycero-alpha-D-manno-heptose 1-phosphate guanylyltransferase|nr:nucleotidyltransferase [Chitinophagaceae bacterium]
MIREAIILAGGLGTRLKEAVPGLPKCMAPVNGKPFIEYVIDHLRAQGITDFIFALGYKSEAFQEYLFHSDIRAVLSVEHEPLGTGGAIRLACEKATGEQVIVTNGDTLFKCDLDKLAAFHEAKDGDCTLCLKPMWDFDRYGVVETEQEGVITSFREKQFYEHGYINGGLYALNAKRLLSKGLPEKFSFEKDYLEAFHEERKMYGMVQDEYFIDIGVPEDYERAQREL